jgi:hypothetical protein
MIVAKRDQRLPLAIFPVAVMGAGTGAGGPYDRAYRNAAAKIDLADGDTLVVVQLENFFALVRPDDVRRCVDARRTAS